MPRSTRLVRTLSIRQPYAHLIAEGLKAVENRSWITRHRGPLAIHAAVTMSCREHAVAERYGLAVDELTRGAVIAVAELVDIEPSASVRARSFKGWGWRRDGERIVVGTHERIAGDVGMGFVWLLGDVQRIEPVPARGTLGLFHVEL